MEPTKPTTPANNNPAEKQIIKKDTNSGWKNHLWGIEMGLSSAWVVNKLWEGIKNEGSEIQNENPWYCMNWITEEACEDIKDFLINHPYIEATNIIGILAGTLLLGHGIYHITSDGFRSTANNVGRFCKNLFFGLKNCVSSKREITFAVYSALGAGLTSGDQKIAMIYGAIIFILAKSWDKKQMKIIEQNSSITSEQLNPVDQIIQLAINEFTVEDFEIFKKISEEDANFIRAYRNYITEQSKKGKNLSDESVKKQLKNDIALAMRFRLNGYNIMTLVINNLGALNLKQVNKKIDAQNNLKLFNLYKNYIKQQESQGNDISNSQVQQQLAKNIENDIIQRINSSSGKEEQQDPVTGEIFV